MIKLKFLMSKFVNFPGWAEAVVMPGCNTSEAPFFVARKIFCLKLHLVFESRQALPL